MKTTYATMTTEHLGPDAGHGDLGHFRAACRLRQAQTGESDEAVTAWMFPDDSGDWPSRVEQTLTAADYWRGIFVRRFRAEAQATQFETWARTHAPAGLEGGAYWRWLVDFIADIRHDAETEGEPC